MDEDTFKYLKTKNLSNITVLSFAEYEIENKQLSERKNSRSKIEYYFTAGPSIIEYIITKFEEINLLTYLDADLYFFSSPEPIFIELENKDIGIISHKLTGVRKIYRKYGIYNVGWISFRNNHIGLQCLKQWKDDCLNWCFDYYDSKYNRFADQKYLEKWVPIFHTLKIIEHKGANVAPWNAVNYKIHIIEDKIFIDEQPLIFYHFSSLKQVDSNKFTTGISKYFYEPSHILKQKIYLPYIKKLLINSARLNNNLIIPRYKNKNISLKDKFQYLSVIIRRYLYDDEISINE